MLEIFEFNAFSMPSRHLSNDLWHLVWEWKYDNAELLEHPSNWPCSTGMPACSRSSQGSWSTRTKHMARASQIFSGESSFHVDSQFRLSTAKKKERKMSSIATLRLFFVVPFVVIDCRRAYSSVVEHFDCRWRGPRLNSNSAEHHRWSVLRRPKSKTSDKDRNMGSLIRDVSPSQGLLQSAISQTEEAPERAKRLYLNFPYSRLCLMFWNKFFPLLNLQVINTKNYWK